MGTADLVARTGLLNCLVRELARSVDGGALLLPASGAVMRVAPGRWPSDPELRTPEGWQPLDLAGLIAVAERELEARTGVRNTALGAEIRDSREVVAALLAARAVARPADDLYLRSEQALVAGHRYHPAAKTRGGGPPEAWLPYAPEACAEFPLRLLGVREDLLAGEGDTGVLDVLWGDRAPKGYRVLPAHPWQLRLIGDHMAVGDGRLIDLGVTAERAWATSSVRTVYLPEADLSLKFSLDVRITNDIRRLWLRDLRWLVAVDEAVAKAFADAPAGASMLADSGYRTAGVGGEDAYEAYAVLVREGFGAGARPLLSAGLSEGFDGSPLPAAMPRAVEWWRRYVERVVPPVLHAFFQHGVVLECHLQNVLVAMDADGMPSRAVFRDHEGVKLLRERHAELLASMGTDVPTPGVDGGYGWERLVYCLVTNHLLEIAGAVAEQCPAVADELWPQAREVFQRFTDHPEVRTLLAAPSVPAKTNLLLRWTDADGGDSTYTPLPNPLRG
ncbi:MULTISPECIES: IucA/IucC family siderophore biosynthesis protein [Streptacidiphilus]|uniref:IucA/IucC family siderophore biosynthesis protein n=1 Tax=Streptacidiphilus cavernicola TaxID=3342716 RepID=A0ABV6UWP9_9ACTN|nr:IucA/IucC family protein [Streptacidiphilus jeojiense]